MSRSAFFSHIAKLILVVLVLGQIGFASAPQVEAVEFGEVIGEGIEAAATCAVANVTADLASDALAAGQNYLNDIFGDFFDAIEDALGGLLPDIPGFGESFVPTHTKLDDPRFEQLAKDTTANCIKRKVLDLVAEAIIAAIVSDTGFVEDFTDELGDSGERVRREVLAEISGVDLCDPFRGTVLTLVGGAEGFVSVDQGPLTSRLRCTLSEVLDIENGDLEAFYSDFRVGNWEAWNKHLEPQNQALGAYLLTEGTLSAVVAAEVEAQQLEFETGDSFRSDKVCTEARLFFTDRPSEVQSVGEVREGSDEWNNLLTSDGVIGGICVEEKIITPGSVLVDQVRRAAGGQLENLIGADTFYEVVTNVVNFMVGTIVDEGLDKLGL
jgi:hypothetical protein